MSHQRCLKIVSPLISEMFDRVISRLVILEKHEKQYVTRKEVARMIELANKKYDAE